MKPDTFKHILCLYFCLTACLSCSTTKYVGEGQLLLDKVKIKTNAVEVRPSEMKPYVQQQPNYKIFGLFKWPLYVYNWSGSNEKKWLNRQLRRMGEPPVLLDDALTEQSVVQLKRYMFNRGYINAMIEVSTDTLKKNRAAVLTYSVNAGEPYRIRRYDTQVLDDDPQIDSIIHLEAPRRSYLQTLLRSVPREYTSVIKENMLFDRAVLDRERQRLTTLLRRHGYYTFNRDYIGYRADSSFAQNCVDLKMYIKPNEHIAPNGTSRQERHKPYYIHRVRILTDYDPLNPADVRITDSATSHGVNIYYGKEGLSLRPAVLQQSCYLAPGMLYSERNVEQTYASYSSLKALRHMSIKFDEFEDSDTMKLNCTILTAPEKKQGVRFEVEGTNSAGDLGLASSLTYQHRNLFKGSELFSAKVRGGYEFLSSTELKGNYWELAGETSLHFPHFLFPFVDYDFRRKIRATTEFKMSYNAMRRPEYHRSILSGGWIYHWQNRINTLARHTFKLMDINYVFLPKKNEDFINSLPETTTLYNYTDQFVVSMGYVYSFNNYDPMERRKNTYSFRVAVESAGNILHAASKLFKAEKDENGFYKLFGINYSEFIKGDVDFARSLTIDKRNSFAFHIGLGVAYPFGNTRELPFERRYYAGGANSNRGWSVRSLGPGGMQRSDTTTFIHQAGDVRFDANIEYRSKLFWKFELAAYIDAGNIWTIRDYDYQKNGRFDFRRFHREIAVSYGLGLRLDFDYFLVRLDSGLKAYDPQAKGAGKWAVSHPNFKNNFAWHFAVGYPF
jgi:outer membrane protein assembly factor BamA